MATGKPILPWFAKARADRQPELVLQGQYDRTDGWAVCVGCDRYGSVAQNDYTGDGKTDLGIWRNSVGRFYVFNPVTSGITVVNGDSRATTRSRATIRIDPDGSGYGPLPFDGGGLFVCKAIVSSGFDDRPFRKYTRLVPGQADIDRRRPRRRSIPARHDSACFA